MPGCSKQIASNPSSFGIFSRLNDCVVIDRVLLLTKHGVKRSDLAPVDIHVATCGYIELAMLVRQNSDCVRVVSLNQLTIYGSRWDTVLDLALQVVVANLQFVLITRLITDLDGQALLFTDFAGQIL